MTEIAPGVHSFNRSLKYLQVELGTRMTVLQLKDGLLLHSPIDLPPAKLEGLGQPTWVIAPNKLHHLFVKPWIDKGLEGWAAPGLPEKRPDVAFKGVVQSGTHPFGSDVEVLALTCFSLSNEVVLFHKPSRTLLVTDLLFNFPPTSPLLTKAVMWCSGCYPGCRASHLERILMKRATAREELRAILNFGFERIIMAHGEVVETDAKAAFENAYRWLKL